MSHRVVSNPKLLVGFSPHHSDSWMAIAAYCYTHGVPWYVCRSRSWALRKRLRKRLNRSRCRLGGWIGWTKEPRIRCGTDPQEEEATFGAVHPMGCRSQGEEAIFGGCPPDWKALGIFTAVSATRVSAAADRPATQRLSAC